MKLYAVFLRDHGRDPGRDMVLVKDGFSWPAFLFTAVWAACMRMWWIAAGLFAVLGLTAWALKAANMPHDVRQLVILAISLTIGVVGNDIRRWFLESQGFSEVAVIGAQNADEAEQRFLKDADIDGERIYP